MTAPDDSKRAEILVEVSRYDVNLFLWRGCVSLEGMKPNGGLVGASDCFIMY